MMLYDFNIPDTVQVDYYQERIKFLEKQVKKQQKKIFKLKRKAK
jgi:hypothetical protein